MINQFGPLPINTLASISSTINPNSSQLTVDVNIPETVITPDMSLDLLSNATWTVPLHQQNDLNVSSLAHQVTRFAPIANKKPDSDDGFKKVHTEDIRYIRDFINSPNKFDPVEREFLLRLVHSMINGTYGSGDIIPDDHNSPETTDPEFNTMVLSPLDNVFLADDLIDDTLLALGVPELLDGHAPNNSGCILNGPPGTGKTILIRAIGKIYRNNGNYAEELNLAQLSDMYVGSLAKNLDTKIKNALKEARKRKKPSLIYLDEATVLLKKVVKGSSVQNYYQAALDVLKKYIGNYPELVFAISTNGEAEIFDDALIREGRLEVIPVNYPQLPQKIQMWEYFLRENNVIHKLKPKQYKKLAEAFPKKSQGAAIEKFAKNFLRKLSLEKLKEQGYPNIRKALQAGISLSKIQEKTRADITFGDLLSAASATSVVIPTDENQNKTTKVLWGFVREADRDN